MAEVNVNYKGSTIKSTSESGTLTLATSGKYMEDNVSIIYERPSSGGGGGSSPTIAYVTKNGNSSTSISFTLAGTPKMFALCVNPSSTLSAGSTRQVVAITWDGSNVRGVCTYTSGWSGSYIASSTNYTVSINGTTLTITSSSSSSGGQFANTPYVLTYCY